MIGVFIPSYNRPCQLHALLESISLHDKWKLFDRIHVRYKGTTPELEAGYKKLTEYGWTADLQPKSEQGLSYDMLQVMSNTRYRYFVVITDDSLFYQDFWLTEDCLYIDFFTEEVNHFTFRCGLNTQVIDYSNPNDKHYLTPLKSRRFNNDAQKLVKFDWTKHTNHYGFPCALDGTLFDREYIFNKTMEVCGPNFDYRMWECKLNDRLRNERLRPYAYCFENSVLVNSPNNMVVENLYCKNGVQYRFTVEELNNRYLADEKIDIAVIDKDSIVSVQQEIPFEFISCR